MRSTTRRRRGWSASPNRIVRPGRVADVFSWRLGPVRGKSGPSPPYSTVVAANRKQLSELVWPRRFSTGGDCLRPNGRFPPSDTSRTALTVCYRHAAKRRDLPSPTWDRSDSSKTSSRTHGTTRNGRRFHGWGDLPPVKDEVDRSVP